MQTRITEDVQEAAGFIRSGELVAFPTETVYGLGADATNAQAVLKAFEAKARPVDNPFIVHIADFADLSGVAQSVSASALALMQTFFPGPLTLILDRHPGIPDVVSSGLPTVGVRMPRHELALKLIRAAGRPIAAPSANLSGRPSPTTWQAVREDLDGKIACILKGERTPVGLESTVVDCARIVPVVLRSGSVTLEQLRTVVPETTTPDTIAPDTTAQNIQVADVDKDHLAPRSPGLRHRHYAPQARIVLIDDTERFESPEKSAYIGLKKVDDPASFLICEQVANLDDYAYRLFEFFRACDRLGAETIYCQRVQLEGFGVALMDRLERAARG